MKGGLIYLQILLLPVLGCDEVHSPHVEHEGHAGHEGGSGVADNEIESSLLLKPVSEYVLSSVTVVRPLTGKFPLSVEASGFISYDPGEIKTVAARVSGRIVKLYLNSLFQPVSKGQKLFEIYSPELVKEQENLLFLMENDPGNKAIIKAVEERLFLLGMSAEQVAEVKKGGKSFYSIPVFSPYSGHLHKPAYDTKAVMPDEISPLLQKDRKPLLSEGMYVEAGQVLLSIYGTERVWALLSVYPEFQNGLKLHQQIIIYSDAGEKNAKADVIEPVISGGTNFISVRCYLENPGNILKPGMSIKAKITGDSISGMFVPFSAVLSLGQKFVVFVREENAFRAREVTVGGRVEDLVCILTGIGLNTEIADNAGFLIDSESFIRINP